MDFQISRNTKVKLTNVLLSGSASKLPQEWSIWEDENFRNVVWWSEHCIWKPSLQFQVRTLHLETLFTVSGQNIVFGNPLHSFRSEHCVRKPSSQFQVRTLYLETIFTFPGQNIAFGNPLHSYRSEHCVWKPSSQFQVRTFGNPLHIFRSEQCFWKPSAQFQVRTLHLKTLLKFLGQNIAFGNPLHIFRSKHCIWKPSAHFQVKTLYLETLFTVSGQNIELGNYLHSSVQNIAFGNPGTQRFFTSLGQGLHGKSSIALLWNRSGDWWASF